MGSPLENQTIGTVAYGGVTFNALTSSKVSAVPEYDEAKRTVVWVNYSLEIAGWLDNGGASTDSLLDMWRQTLLTPGQALLYTQKGFGTFAINSGSQRDAAWGPTPELLSFEPMGNLGCKINWKVTGRIPSCPNAQFQKALAALNYEMTWTCSGETGLTTRRISGYLEIPMTRQNGGRKLPDSADAYWEKFYPPPIDGFRRSHERTLDKSKRKLTFTITDEEMYAPYPNGVLKCNARHNVSSGMDKSFNIWRCSLVCDFSMIRDGFTKADAWSRFQIILQSRLRPANARTEFVQAIFGEDAESVVMPQELEIDDDIFGPGTTISYRYLLMGTDLSKILEVSGLWQPIESKGARNNTWDGWRSSMRNVFGARSTAQMGFKPNDELIIDLCAREKPPPPSGLANAKNPKKAKPGNDAAKAKGDPNRGWINFRNVFRFVVDGRVITHTPLGSVGSYNGPAKSPPPDKNGDAYDSTGVVDLGVNPGNLLILQKISTPIVEIIMEGHGVRVGDKVLVPTLRQVAGQPVVIAESKVNDNEAIGGCKGMPIYKSTWRIRYKVTLPPRGALPSLANPALGIDGTNSGQNLGN